MRTLQDLFGVEPTSVKDLLCDRDMCFYMPSYQRKYSWAQANIQRLFEDFRVNFYNALKEEDAIVFLGTVLTMKDNNGKQVQPKPNDIDNLPTKIRLVVDGQQRLTTLLLTLTRFHNLLVGYHHGVLQAIEEAEQNSGEHLGKLNRVRSLLDDAIAYSKFFSTLGTHHPKIIREDDDCWQGRNADGCSFESPVAEYLYKFGAHYSKHANSKEPYPSFNVDYTSYNDNTTVKNAVAWIDEELNTIKQGFVTEGVGHITEKCLSSENLREHLDVTAPSGLDETPWLKEIVLICAHFKFIIERVCITFVTVNAESYAFDMFEALNTSGEPLTAYETLRPKIIKHKRDLGKKFDDIHQLTVIDELFNAVEEKAKASKDKSVSDLKHKATTDIARIFAYYHDGSGASINPNLGRQRKYLLNHYDSCDTESARERYLNAFTISSRLQLEFWADGNCNLFEDIDSEAMCAAQHLRHSGHSVVSAALVFFAHRQQLDIPANNELSDALKAIAAFQGLWRAYTGKTAQIDSVYKEFYQKGCKGVDMPPLNAENLNKVSVSKFKEALMYKLNILVSSNQTDMFTSSKDQWLTTAVSTNTKQYNKILPLILSASMHKNSYNPGFKQREAIEFWHLLDETASAHILKNYGIAILIEEPMALDSTYSIGNRILADKALTRTLNKSNDWEYVGAHLRKALDDNDPNMHNTACDSILNHSEETQQSIVDYRIRNSYMEFNTACNAWTDESIASRSQQILNDAWDTLETWLN